MSDLCQLSAPKRTLIGPLSPIAILGSLSIIIISPLVVVSVSPPAGHHHDVAMSAALTTMMMMMIAASISYRVNEVQ
jgi:hypothetical protein